MSEPIPGTTTVQLQKLAEKNGVYVVFGMAKEEKASWGLSCTILLPSWS